VPERGSGAPQRRGGVRRAGFVFDFLSTAGHAHGSPRLAGEPSRSASVDPAKDDSMLA
jgi:hypothetical protein